jgi:hypothetical protein
MRMTPPTAERMTDEDEFKALHERAYAAIGWRAF